MGVLHCSAGTCQQLGGLWASPQALASQYTLYPLVPEFFSNLLGSSYVQRGLLGSQEAYRSWAVLGPVPLLIWGLEKHNGVSAPEHGQHTEQGWGGGRMGMVLRLRAAALTKLAFVLSCAQFPHQRRCPT